MMLPVYLCLSIHYRGASHGECKSTFHFTSSSLHVTSLHHFCHFKVFTKLHTLRQQIYSRKFNESSLLSHLLMFSLLRESETRHENIKEELPNVKPSVQPVSDQNNQEETIDMVGFQVMCRKHSFTGFL